MKTRLAFIILAALLAAFVGCSRDVETGDTGILSVVSVGGVNETQEQCVTLWAGQDIDAGTVCVSVIDEGADEQLCITYNTTGGWELVETHSWVGDALADMPQTKKGNPKIGNFPYASGDITGATTWEICIPLSAWGTELDDQSEFDLCGKVLYAAAHAALQLVDDTGTVIQTETGWGDGNQMVDGRSWATYFSIALTCNDGYPPTIDGCETAFAYGCEDYANCFIDLGDILVDEEDPGIARWGWTNGPLDVSTYSFDIYAGAGQCDLTKGTLVGMLAVDYSGGSATVTYSTYGGFQMEEVHLYVGHEILPRDNKGDYTVASGQLGHTMEFTNPVFDYTYTVDGLTGAPIYVVAHAVVCGDYDAAPVYDPVCDQETCDSWIVYGSNLNGGADPLDDAIYAYDLYAKTQTLVYDPGSIQTDQNYPNANAYDPVNNRIYFGTSDGRLFYHEIGSGTHVQVASGFGTMACGSWYNGKFYYVQNNTNNLYEVTVDDVAGEATRVFLGDVPTSNGYGDIAFDPANPGVFIGSAGSTAAVWYMYDLGTNISTVLTANTSKHKQLAYGSDGVLYGVDALTGEFSTITYDAVAKTVTLTAYWDSDYTFTDLASGPQCQ